jgi:hypothetical protein
MEIFIMMLGMSLETFTLFHVLISLVGIVTGFLVIFGILSGRSSSALTAIFLITTVATSVTGFGFPVEHVMPSHIVGVISLLVLAIAIPALYFFKLARAWRWVYVIGATLALYLNFFVLIVQSFLKVPALKALAPKQTEPPFLIAQSAALVLFIVLGTLAVKKSGAEAGRTAGA